MWGRIWTIFVSRNKEFYRDKPTLIWNFLFPIFIIGSFFFMFSNDNQKLYKIGVIRSTYTGPKSVTILEDLKKIKYTELIWFDSPYEAEDKLVHHKIDLLIDPAGDAYFVSASSAKGYISEILIKHTSSNEAAAILSKNVIAGREIPYVEWMFPGIIGMNLMFSALFGVGIVLVRYRKNGVLKRFYVTPLHSFEFLSAQILSRLFLMMVSASIIFAVVSMLFNFECKGSYLDLFVLTLAGSASLISLGLVVASRLTSEELTDGLLNLITWPMMILSEVWFSLEGSVEWVRVAAKAMPLWHLVDGARKIMNDGATLWEIRSSIVALFGITAVGLFIGSILFKWKE